jgi:hypothetical protein
VSIFDMYSKTGSGPSREQEIDIPTLKYVLENWGMRVGVWYLSFSTHSLPLFKKIFWDIYTLKSGGLLDRCNSIDKVEVKYRDHAN